MIAVHVKQIDDIAPQLAAGRPSDDRVTRTSVSQGSKAEKLTSGPLWLTEYFRLARPHIHEKITAAGDGAIG